jgi:hypothetical protein
MTDNKGLGIGDLGSVDWLNDSSPAPEAAETQSEETTEATEPVVEATEEPAEEPTTKAPEETTDEVETTEADEPAGTPDTEPVQETEVAQEEEAASMFATLGAKLGYEVEGDFSEDYDGLAEYTSAVGEQIAKEQLEKIFASMPDVKEYFEYRANNGDPLKYFEAQQAEVDYNAVDLSNEAHQKRVIIDGMRQQGFGDEDITRMVESYEDAGILADNAGVYLKQLQATQGQRKEQLLAQQQQQAAAQRAEAEAYWNSVHDTINGGNLKGMQIPQRQRSKFYEWMTTPVNENGFTQRDLDRQNIDQETALAVEYLLYQGFDLKKLAGNAAATQKVSSLKSKLSSAPSAGSRMKSRTKSGTTKPNGLPSLKDLL